MLQLTLNCWPCGWLGWIVTLHVPRELLSVSLVSEKVTVEGELAPLTPPRFSITAASTHGSSHELVPGTVFWDTESTLYSGGQVVGSSKSNTLVGCWMPKSLS